MKKVIGIFAIAMMIKVAALHAGTIETKIEGYNILPKLPQGFVLATYTRGDVTLKNCIVTDSKAGKIACEATVLAEK